MNRIRLRDWSYYERHAKAYRYVLADKFRRWHLKRYKNKQGRRVHNAIARGATTRSTVVRWFSCRAQNKPPAHHVRAVFRQKFSRKARRGDRMTQRILSRWGAAPAPLGEGEPAGEKRLLAAYEKRWPGKLCGEGKHENITSRIFAAGANIKARGVRIDEAALRAFEAHGPLDEAG